MCLVRLGLFSVCPLYIYLYSFKHINFLKWSTRGCRNWRVSFVTKCLLILNKIDVRQTWRLRCLVLPIVSSWYFCCFPSCFLLSNLLLMFLWLHYQCCKSSLPVILNFFFKFLLGLHHILIEAKQYRSLFPWDAFVVEIFSNACAKVTEI